MKIVSTDNMGRDYPDEKFLCWEDSKGNTHPIILSDREATVLCIDMQNIYGHNSDRFYKVVPNDYVLLPGFEP